MKHCGLCKQEAVDSMEFEVGNNAEYQISVDLCQAHLEEEEKTGYAFEEKYGADLEKILNERMPYDCD